MADFINEAVNGVISALAEHFPNYPIYDELTEQGLEEPCFFVRCVRPLQELYRGNRYLVEQVIEVVFFPPNEKRNKTSNSIIEKLFSILEVVQAGADPIRGSNPQAHLNDEDGTAVFTITYRYFANKVDTPVPMETLTVKGMKLHEEY